MKTNPLPPLHKKYVCHLPFALASRLEALCEMHPEKTRSQLLNDLLALGLAEVARASVGAASCSVFSPDTQQPVYLLTGPFDEFHGLVHKHHLAMAHELAQDESPVYPAAGYSLGDAE